MTNILQASAQIAAALLLISSAASAQPGTDAAASQNSVKLATVVMALPAGRPCSLFRISPYCLSDQSVRNATGAREPQDLPPYTAAFKTELERAGYRVVSSDENLFDREGGAADYQVAAVVTDAHIVACISTGGMLSAGRMGDARGDGSMKIDW